MFFKDGKKRIDYILAWSTEGKPEKLAHSQEARAVFEENLEQEGLKLEKDEVSYTRGLQLKFYSEKQMPIVIVLDYTVLQTQKFCWDSVLNILLCLIFIL